MKRVRGTAAFVTGKGIRREGETRIERVLKNTVCIKQEMKLFALRSEELTRYNGEFDPGSELTLAARIKHASRTGLSTFGCS